MKSERRHELQKNKLALWVADFVKRMQPHVNKVLLGITALLAIFVILSIWRSLAAKNKSAAWEELFATMGAGAVDRLETMAEDAPSESPSRWASLIAAERHLAYGSILLFNTKADATQELHKAIADYTGAIEQRGKAEPELLERAYFGRARAHESLASADLGNWTDLDTATADYQQVVSRWPNGPYTAMAKRQLDLLGAAQGKKFYEKFAAYTPKSAAERRSNPLTDMGETLRRTAPEGEPSSTPLMDEILRGLEATTPKPPTETPFAIPGIDAPKPGAETPKPGAETPKPGVETPAAGKSAIPDLPKLDPAKTEPAKTEPATTESPKADPGKTEPEKK
jgi:hypothetical protein